MSLPGSSPTLIHVCAGSINVGSVPDVPDELANQLHRALVLSDRKVITDEELTSGGDTLPLPDAESAGGGAGAAAEEPARDAGAQVKRSARVDNPSKGEVRQAMATCGGNQTRAAETLGIPRSRLRELLQFYALPLPRGSGPPARAE